MDDFQHAPLEGDDAKRIALGIAIQWLSTIHIDEHSRYFANYAYEDRYKIKSELAKIKESLRFELRTMKD